MPIQDGSQERLGRELSTMMRRCLDRDFELIWATINDGTEAYKGIIPADRWTEPFMSREELQRQIDEGVFFCRCCRTCGD